MKSSKIIKLFFLLFFFTTSCNYKAGLTNKSETINIRLDVKNNSNAIQLSPILNRILKDELSKITAIKLVSSSNKKTDYSVELVVGNYSLSPESFLTDDTLIANAHKATLGVQMKVLENKSQNLILHRKYSFSSALSKSINFDHHNDRQLHQSIARDLSSRISRDLVHSLL